MAYIEIFALHKMQENYLKEFAIAVAFSFALDFIWFMIFGVVSILLSKTLEMVVGKRH